MVKNCDSPVFCGSGICWKRWVLTFEIVAVAQVLVGDGSFCRCSEVLGNTMRFANCQEDLAGAL